MGGYRTIPNDTIRQHVRASDLAAPRIAPARRARRVKTDCTRSAGPPESPWSWPSSWPIFSTILDYKWRNSEQRAAEEQHERSLPLRHSDLTLSPMNSQTASGAGEP